MSFPRTIRLAVVAALGALLFAATLVSAAPTQKSFDGSWSVVIVTEKGDCDRAYRYPIKISNGSVANGGGAAFDISGKVGHDGALTVRVSRGEKSATGIGRLSEASGTGKWTGGACAGTWTAERRG